MSVYVLLCQILGAERVEQGQGTRSPHIPTALNEDTLYSQEATFRFSPKTEDEVVLKQQMNNIVSSVLMRESIYTPMQGVQVIGNRTRNVCGEETLWNSKNNCRWFSWLEYQLLGKKKKKWNIKKKERKGGLVIYVKGICIARQWSWQEEKILVKFLWEMYSSCWDYSLQLRQSYTEEHLYLQALCPHTSTCEGQGLNWNSALYILAWLLPQGHSLWCLLWSHIVRL